METTGISLGEAMTLCNNNGYGNQAMWNNPFMYLMWASMFGGNGFGFGFGNNRGGVATTVDLAQGLDNQDKNGQLRGIANGLADLGYALNNSIKDTGAGVAKEVKDLGAGIAMGFCNTNHNIENLKYENAKNTADIISNATANTQRIMDGICGLKMDAKDAQIQALSTALADAKLNLSQVAQNAYLVEKLTPAT